MVKGNVTSEDVFRAVTNVHRSVRGAYAVVAMIIGHGLIAFRDPNGIRPLCLGKREVEGKVEYMVASESVALDAVGFDFVRDDRFNGGRNNDFDFVLEKRNFFCWTIQFVYNRSHRDNGFFVTLSPSAFPETTFRREQFYRSLK